MDCSDGAANAIYQLGSTNNLDVILERDIKWDLPSEFVNILKSQNMLIENACFSFGDWQLACLVPKRHEVIFRGAASRIYCDVSWSCLFGKREDKRR